MISFKIFLPSSEVHYSHLVNLKCVQKYTRGNVGQLVMSDGSRVSVARSRKDRLLGKIKPVLRLC